LSKRIASLLPAATEWLAVFGLGPSIVGVSHECDYPAETVRGKARVTSSRVDSKASALEIDRQVRELRAAGADLYQVDARALEALEVDLIVTQAQCDVCAVSEDAVRALAASLPRKPAVVATSGSTVEGVLADALAIAEATGADALPMIERYRRGFREIRKASLAGARRQPPRLVHLEWTDPPMAAASWIPELVAAAGYECFRAELTGKKSVAVTWEEIAAFDPDVLVLAPCGFELERAEHEGRRVLARPEIRELLRPTSAFQGDRVYAVEGNALFNRPGPRLLESARLLARIERPSPRAVQLLTCAL
jgi:iron complex transport system substrate-binding protein